MMRFAVAALALALATGSAQADSKSHKQAAEELLKAMNMDKQMEAAIEQVSTMLTKSQPALAPHKAVLKKFYTKHMSFAALKGDLVKIYTDAFKETELKQLTK